MSDITTFGLCKIFKPYDVSDRKDSFEEYFNKSLNPDLSPSGFLEELDRLIQISYKRPVVIATTGTEYELEKIRVLKEYLSSIPPF